jgi:hypothetical protein
MSCQRVDARAPARARSPEILAAYAGTANYTNVDQYTCNRTGAQLWYFAGSNPTGYTENDTDAQFFSY